MNEIKERMAFSQSFLDVVAELQRWAVWVDGDWDWGIDIHAGIGVEHTVEFNPRQNAGLVDSTPLILSENGHHVGNCGRQYCHEGDQRSHRVDVRHKTLYCRGAFHTLSQ